ncbi:MAG: hypothetical protein L3J75_16600 [Methylococcaceae bacterium]|nr:hypothetical protein [Methylococcaceae bacterium]
MKLQELKKAVHELYVFDELLILGTHGNDGETSIIEENSSWVVSSYQRGNRQVDKVFSSEEEACDYVYTKFKNIEDNNFNCIVSPRYT